MKSLASVDYKFNCLPKKGGYICNEILFNEFFMSLVFWALGTFFIFLKDKREVFSK